MKASKSHHGLQPDKIEDPLHSMYPEFYALMRPKAEKKKRKCLQCGIMRMSEGPHDRLCKCHIRKQAHLASYTVALPVEERARVQWNERAM